MFGYGNRNKAGFFGKKNGGPRTNAVAKTPLVQPKPVESQQTEASKSQRNSSLSQSALFVTPDGELAHYLTVEHKQGSHSELRELSEQERYPGLNALLLRTSFERAKLFVHTCDLLEQFRERERVDKESAAPFRPMSHRADALQSRLISIPQLDYTLADLVVMSTHFCHIAEYYAASNYFAKAAFETHETDPGPESTALLETMCGDEAERNCLNNKRNETALTYLAMIEKAHVALGNAPGTHRLSQMRAAEMVPYVAEIERLVANCPPDVLPYFRLLMDSRDRDVKGADAHNADLELLQDDLQSRSPEEKGRAFLSILQMADAVQQSPLVEHVPELGVGLIRPAQVLRSAEGNLRALAAKLARKKLVFPPHGAVELLRNCSTEKFYPGQRYRPIPSQFWKSLGNSLPKNNGEVRHLIASASLLGEKRQDTLMKMAGFDEGEVTLDSVSEAYLRPFFNALESLLSASSQSGRGTPVAGGGGILDRIFSSAKTSSLSDDWNTALRTRSATRDLLETLPSACYLNADLSELPDLLNELKEANTGLIAQKLGASAVPETVSDADALAMSLSYHNQVYAAVSNVADLVRAESIVEAFGTFSQPEREALAEFVSQLHPLPTGAKPTAKWLERSIDNLPDDLIEKLLTVIVPVSSKNDEIIIAAVFATARMPDIGIEMLERIVVSGFEDAPNGKRHERLANAGLWVLSQRRSEAAISAMKRIAETCRFMTGRKQATTYLAEMVTGDVDDPVMSGELRLPSLKICPDAYREPLVEGSAVFTYNAPDRITLRWQTPDGILKASPSAAMKSADATGIKRLKTLVRSLDRTLQTHIRWIERLYLSDASFRFDEWRERYANHETRGALTRSLIWRAESKEGRVRSFMPAGDAFVGADGEAVDPSTCTISLWHPVNEPGTVVRWRSHLVKNAIVQPFAQAFRSTQGADDFDAAVDIFMKAHVARVWGFDFSRHVTDLGWVAAKKLDMEMRRDATVKVHFFDPVSRLYIETSLTPSTYKHNQGFVTGPVEIARANLGACPSKSGLVKKKLSDLAEMTAVQRVEIVRLLHGMIAHGYSGSVEKGPPSLVQSPVPAEVPALKIVLEERVAAIGAYASLLADPHAAGNWRNKDKGEPRISVRDDGRLLINGVRNSYIFCLVEDECYRAEDGQHWHCAVRDGHRDGARNVPFGMDSVLRNMSAKIHLMTKDDRPGSGILEMGTRY